LVLNDYRIGLAHVETTPEEADRETIIRNFISGEYSDALRVVAFNVAEAWSRDVSEDIAIEVLERAFDADDALSEATKRFVGRHGPRRRRCGAKAIGLLRRSTPDAAWQAAGLFVLEYRNRKREIIRSSEPR
jgi:hypothetical protein